MSGPRSPPSNGQSRSVAIVLTLFLGGIGAHRFYLNSPVVGVFYVLFCWTLIPGIIALFELIGLCCMGARQCEVQRSSREWDRNDLFSIKLQRYRLFKNAVYFFQQER